MFEKVNPAHPDKLADRIAGALVDMAYRAEANPRIAVEILLGHGTCHIIAETSVALPVDEVTATVHRIAGPLKVDYAEVPQDAHLSRNQTGAIRCGDNGMKAIENIFAEERALYAQEMASVEQYSSSAIEQIIQAAKEESLQIYHELQELDPKRQSVRGQLEGINRMFSMNIDFDAEWLRFIGMDGILRIAEGGA